MQVLLCPEKSRPEENKDKAVLEYTAAVDAWAVGIVCYELLIGHPPFERESPTQTSEHIMYRAPPMPPSLSPGAKQFIVTALVKVSHALRLDSVVGQGKMALPSLVRDCSRYCTAICPASWGYVTH